MATAKTMDCGDFLEFQDALQKMRLLDDKIIYTLNTTIPTESFKGALDAPEKCKDLFEQIRIGHSQREGVIKDCINATRERVKNLKHRKETASDDPSILKSLRKEQNKLRLLQSELGVEEVVKQRTNQVFSEKCRTYYKPPSLDS